MAVTISSPALFKNTRSVPRIWDFYLNERSMIRTKEWEALYEHSCTRCHLPLYHATEKEIEVCLECQEHSSNVTSPKILCKICNTGDVYENGTCYDCLVKMLPLEEGKVCHLIYGKHGRMRVKRCFRSPLYTLYGYPACNLCKLHAEKANLRCDVEGCYAPATIGIYIPHRGPEDTVISNFEGVPQGDSIRSFCKRHTRICNVCDRPGARFEQINGRKCHVGCPGPKEVKKE